MSVYVEFDKIKKTSVCYAHCSGCSADGPRVRRDDPESAMRVAKRKGWGEVRVEQRTPTGRIKMRGGWRILSLCPKCLKKHNKAEKAKLVLGLVTSRR